MKTQEKDSMIYLVVPGRTPSKKNKKRPFVRNGRMMIFNSKDYVQWHKDALRTLKLPSKCLESVRAIRLCFFSENKRKFDLSNKAESIMDLLVDAGYLSDDNFEVVPELCLNYMGVDKENPRCEVCIYII